MEPVDVQCYCYYLWVKKRESGKQRIRNPIRMLLRQEGIAQELRILR